MVTAFENEEQLEIRASVRKLAEREIPKYQNDTYYGTVPRPLFEAFAELGLTGLAVPEELGGVGAAPLTTAAVMEELARVDLGPAVFLSVHTMVSGLINRFGSPDLKQRYLPGMAAGNLLGAFALTEPGAGSDAASLRTTAVRTGDSYKLNGEKCYITSAGFADVYITFANADPTSGKSGITAFLIDKDAEGLTIGVPERKMGGELSPIASLTLADCRLDQSQRVGEECGGYKIALGGLAGGRINIAACANGLASVALERAVMHLQQREQFGRKLSDFQGLQFMLADMRMQLEAARLLVAQAATSLATNPDSRQNRLYPALAKCFATDAAMRVTTDAVQLLGGAGYLKEYNVERLMREAKVLQIVEGTNQIQRSVIAREMLES